jgi:hypothetical protein
MEMTFATGNLPPYHSPRFLTRPSKKKSVNNINFNFFLENRYLLGEFGRMEIIF